MSFTLRFTLLAVLTSSTLSISASWTSSSAQRQIPVEVKLQETFVLDFGEPYKLIHVDAGETTVTTNDIVEIQITSSTVFQNDKKKPVNYKLIRPGVRLDITLDKLGSDLTAKVVTVKTNLEKWAVTVEGYVENLDDTSAKIDGQTVALEKNGKIKGEGQWQKQSFGSLKDLMLGAEARVKGLRKEDGIIYATEIGTRPNEFSKGERVQRLKLSENLFSPTIEQDGLGNVKKLSGGMVKMGGKEFKLVENLEVQTYINKVGNKLVPRYVKDLPRDDPSKLLFRFYVIEDGSINAFAFADGSVFINTGLMKILKNEAQLASVLGHEIAHATHEHSRRTNESWSSQVLGIGKKTGLLSDADMVTFGLGLFANKFDRDMENQADRVGLMYMYEAGYDPREAPKVWRELSKLTNEHSIETFLYSSHPMAVSRLKNLNREIAYNYYQTDFSQTQVKEKEYMGAVGMYFGWIKPPERPKANQPAGKSPTNTSPKPSSPPKKTSKPGPKKP